MRLPVLQSKIYSPQHRLGDCRHSRPWFSLQLRFTPQTASSFIIYVSCLLDLLNFFQFLKDAYSLFPSMPNQTSGVWTRFLKAVKNLGERSRMSGSASQLCLKMLHKQATPLTLSCTFLYAKMEIMVFSLIGPLLWENAYKTPRIVVGT